MYVEDDVPVNIPAVRGVGMINSLGPEIIVFLKIFKKLCLYLLDQKKINDIWENGLQENPVSSVGNYIGQLCYTPEKGIIKNSLYRKYTQLLPAVWKREEISQHTKKTYSIKEKQEQIARLQQEIVYWFLHWSGTKTNQEGAWLSR